MFMQRWSQFDKSEKWAYFVSWCVVGGPSFLRGTTRGLLAVRYHVKKEKYIPTLHAMIAWPTGHATIGICKTWFPYGCNYREDWVTIFLNGQVIIFFKSLASSYISPFRSHWKYSTLELSRPKFEACKRAMIWVVHNIAGNSYHTSRPK
jgi:hypothetical protein